MVLRYKGFYTKTSYNYDKMVFEGKIENIPENITFKCGDPERIQDIFESLVDNYIERTSSPCVDGTVLKT